MAASNGQPKYVYGVVRASMTERLDATGIADQRLDAVPLEEIAALTSDAVAEEFDAGRDELLAHAHAIEHAFEHGVVLPMRFGVVMPSAAAVREELLAPHREQLEAQLSELEGQVEVNVKGIYEEAAILQEILAEDAEAAELRRLIRDRPEDATYPERIRLGEIVAERLGMKRDSDGEAISSRLARHALRTDVGEPVHERMAVNASFLIAEDQRSAFDEDVDALAAEQADRIRFKYTGPLPPYSFVELSLEE